MLTERRFPAPDRNAGPPDDARSLLKESFMSFFEKCEETVRELETLLKSPIPADRVWFDNMESAYSRLALPFLYSTEQLFHILAVQEDMQQSEEARRRIEEFRTKVATFGRRVNHWRQVREQTLRQQAFENSPRGKAYKQQVEYDGQMTDALMEQERRDRLPKCKPVGEDYGIPDYTD
jgi:hypothetical protein